jgi:SAM-dependent methyltransferase
MASNKDVFDKHAAQYGNATYWRGDEQAIVTYFKPGTMLVGGVGGGRTIPHLQRSGKWTVTAIDIAPAMVEECRKKGIDAHVMDIQHTTFPDNTFDTIFLPFHTIAYVDSVPETLKELRRILKPDGVLVMSLPNRFFIKNFLTGELGKEGFMTIDRQHPDHLHAHFFGYFDRIAFFKHVRRFGRMALYQNRDGFNWKDSVLAALPFFDKSMYFVCSGYGRA